MSWYGIDYSGRSPAYRFDDSPVFIGSFRKRERDEASEQARRQARADRKVAAAKMQADAAAGDYIRRKYMIRGGGIGVGLGLGLGLGATALYKRYKARRAARLAQEA